MLKNSFHQQCIFSITLLVSMGTLAGSAHAQLGTLVPYDASQVTNYWIRGLDGNPNNLSPPWTHRTPADPAPFGFANNLDNLGWIPPLSVDGTNNAAALPFFSVDFGEPQAITGLRAYSTFAGDSRGMELGIDHSDDGSNWFSDDGTAFQFTTEWGMGKNDAGGMETRNDGHGGWYDWSFNGSQLAHRYWRLHSTGNQASLVNGHAPRIGELEFYTTGTVAAPPSFEWNTSYTGSWMDPSNWKPLGGPPISSAQTARFGTGDSANITDPTTVVTNSEVTVNRIEFDNATHNYAVAGLGTVNLLEDTTNSTLPSIVVSAGNHEFQARVALDADASIQVANNASLQLNNQLDLGGNTLTLSGAVDVNHSITGGGGVSGSGTLGTASSTSIVGDLTYNGNINMDITGDSGAMGQVDFFDVTGAADLSGATVNVNIDFSPTSSDSYTLLTASQGIDDSNLNVNLPTGFSYQVVSGNGSSESLIVAFQTGSGVTGDYNGNGTVDAADYTLFRDNLGGDSSILANNDIPGAITWAHYDQWKMGFGSLGVGNTNGAAIPEPASLSLVLIGLMLVVARRSGNFARTD